MGSVLRELHLLSAGAAQSVAVAVIPAFRAAAGAEVHATFRTVGVLKEMVLAAEPCDVLVSTAAMLDDFARDGRVLPASIRTLGRVQTGIAVRSDEPLPAIGNRALLRASLAAAMGIYLPDPERATAGIHFVKVLRELGVHDDLAPPLHAYPNGAIAMVTLVGTLPAPFELATTYAAAACTSAREPELAQRFVQMLAGPDALELRSQAGFEA